MITGFPIVTEKKSSHTIRLSRRDFTKESNHEIISAIPLPSTEDPSFVSDKDDIIVPLSLHRDYMKQNDNISMDDAHAEFSVTQSNPKHCFTAIMNVKYYHVIRRTCIVSNQQEQEDAITMLKINISTIAEVQIFLSPWSSSEHIQQEQNQVHRFVCSTLEMEEEIKGTLDEVENSSWNMKLPKYFFGDIVSAQVTFSENGKYLACIVPRPIQQMEESSNPIPTTTTTTTTDPPLSLVVIFPLSPPTLEEDIDMKGPWILPQPFYLQNKVFPSDIESNLLPPNIGKAYTIRISPDVDIDDINSSTSKWISQIVHLADYSFSGVHLLLGGCNDGSLVVINYKRGTVLGCIFTPRKACGIRDLQCFKCEFYAKIAAVYSDGRVEMFKSYLNKEGIKGIDDEKQFGTRYHDLTCNVKYNPFCIRTWLMKVQLSPKSCSGLKFDKVSFVNERTIATLVRPLHIQSGKESNNAVYADIIAQVWLFDPILPNPVLLSTLKMDNDTLGNLGDDGIERSVPVSEWNKICSGSIEFDSRSNCILISSAVPSHRSTSHYPNYMNAFVTLWDWQTATTAITMPCSIDTVHFVCNHKLQLYWDTDRAHLLCESVYVDRFTRVHYYLALLSPSRYIQGRQGLRNPNQVLFEYDSVAYPSLLERTVLKDWQVQWKCAKIPSNYIENNGAIQTAVMGDRYGKTLVLAGSTGISVLTINEVKKSGICGDTNEHIKFHASCQIGHNCDVSRTQHKHIHNKWSMFRQRDERKVLISSIALWENYVNKGNDLIIAITRYHGHGNCKDSDIYLVAWSSAGIDLKKQLLVPFKDSGSVEKHPVGIRIVINPANHSMHVLHSCCRNGNHFEAALLITEYDGGLLSYQIFQLSISGAKEGTNGQVICNAVARGRLNENIPDINAVFLARHSFTDSGNGCDIATIGVIYNHGATLSTFSVDTNGQICSCKIFDSFRLHKTSRRIIQFWHEDDFLSESSVEESWTWNMVLSDGSLLAWNTSRCKNLVHPENGIVKLHRNLTCDCETGTTHSEEECNLCGYISMEKECISCGKIEPGAYLLGPLPNCTSRHLIYVCQKFQIRLIDDTEMSLFGVSDFDVGVPSNSSSFLLFLSIVSMYEMSGMYAEAEALVMDLVNSIRRLRTYESTISIFRTIAAFLTDLVLRVSRKAPKMYQKRAVLKLIQSQMVRVAMYSLLRIQFASLFLGVGRQLEAHHFEYLFPLPMSWNASEGPQKLSLLEIFTAAVNDGSFSIPAGALPLIPDRQTDHRLCINLLHHIICTLSHFDKSMTIDVNCMREELASFRQLFLYSLKLEDAQRLHLSQQIEGTYSQFTRYDVSFYNRHSNNPHMLKRLLSLFNPFNLAQKHASEHQISEAALSFILTGYGDERKILDIDSESSISEESSSDSSIGYRKEENILFHVTSCVMISMSITFKVFLSTASPKNGIRNLTAMCMLMFSGTETICYLSIKNWLCDLTKDKLLDLLIVRRRILHFDQSFESLLESLISDCVHNWNQHEANAVACSIYTILSNGDDSQDAEIFFTGLKLLLLVALHVTRNEIVATSSFQDSDLGCIYRKVTEERMC